MSDEQPLEPQRATLVDSSKAPLPKGVVLGKDGKPCRSCTSVSSWMAMAKSHKSSSDSSTTKASSSYTTANTSAPESIPSNCPPDVEALGRSTWTLLHTLTATYPEQPTPTEQAQAKNFISLFSNMYPCSVCAEDFRDWMQVQGNEPKLRGQEEFGRWMCMAHNAVNTKLGKVEFDCGRWKERWKDGWRDGRCD